MQLADTQLQNIIKISKESNYEQWRTQKIFMGGSFSGKWGSFVFGVRCL